MLPGSAWLLLLIKDDEGQTSPTQIVANCQPRLSATNNSNVDTVGRLGYTPQVVQSSVRNWRNSVKASRTTV